MTKRRQATTSPEQPRRKKLGDMTPKEVQAWVTSTRDELVSFSAYIQQYLDRRARNQRHTSTDERYTQFQRLAADLIAALDEIQEAAVNITSTKDL